MNTKNCIFTVFAALFSALAAFGQTPPPNDNYSNSITLTGTDITFSGTLAGATIEDSNETVATEYMLSQQPTQSIWWNWTAPTDTVLTLQIVSSSFQLSGTPWTWWQGVSDAVVVYGVTNGGTAPNELVQPPVGSIITIPLLAPQTFSAPVTGGSNYQIQLIGNSSANYTFRLAAANTPVIITQPRSQTVYSNAAVTLYVVYAGLGQVNQTYGVPQTNFTFQWYFNGTILPDETAPMLALTNIDSTMAGAYTVAVSNSAGATLSAPATLTVSQSNFPVVLNAIGFAVTNCFGELGGFLTNAFCYTVNGESGRSYCLQSSTNLLNWCFENDFPLLGPENFAATSVFFRTNAAQVLASPTYTSPRFFRVMPYVIGNPQAEICINNLQQIRIAEMLWQRDHNSYADATPAASDIVHYFPHQTLPFCPEDNFQTFETSYLIQSVQGLPTCEINPTNHILIEPQ